jgi:hypothetical protein
MDATFFNGCQACADGKKQADNPHAAGTLEHTTWNRGWADEYQRLPQALRALRLLTEASDADQ